MLSKVFPISVGTSNSFCFLFSVFFYCQSNDGLVNDRKDRFEPEFVITPGFD